MSLPDTDLLIIGGGINGAGIARDAAGRGLRVVLCEKDDLASHTSSASSKLIHGGLRYLEYYEFRLVRKALQEREVLLRLAPHLIHPLRFVMPLAEGMRPAWLIRLGLFLYDHLASLHKLAPSKAISLRQHVAGHALQRQYQRGFEYADAWVHDARLVLANAIDAAERGAQILTRTLCTDVRRDQDHWLVSLRDQQGEVHVLRARAVVNAAGPWALPVARALNTAASLPQVRLVKGSHIVVRRLFEHDYAYIFQHKDKRIVFAIPYQNEFTLIGTTDLDFDGDPDRVAISQGEIDYLCDLASQYFKQQLSAADVLDSFSGVRPLLEFEHGSGAAALPRDYQLQLDQQGPPVLHVWGGKITTYRILAEQAMNLLAPLLHSSPQGWSAQVGLPGADCYGESASATTINNFQEFCLDMQQRYDWLPTNLLQRYLRQYGSRLPGLLEQRRHLHEMGEALMPDLYEAEVRYLIRHEWALCVDDVILRRTQLGTHLKAADSTKLRRFMQAELGDSYFEP